MNVLITGAGGFLGKGLVGGLKKEHSLTLMDICDMRSSHKTIKADICNYKEVKKGVKYDSIYNSSQSKRDYNSCSNWMPIF